MNTDTVKAFSLIYSQAELLLKTFPEYQFKTVTAIVIVLGWLLTAETAQLFISQHAQVTFPATALAFTILTIFEYIWLKAHANKIKRSYLKLKELSVQLNLSTDCIELFNLDDRLYKTYVLLNVLLSLSVVTTVYLICY